MKLAIAITELENMVVDRKVQLYGMDISELEGTKNHRLQSEIRALQLGIEGLKYVTGDRRYGLLLPGETEE